MADNANRFVTQVKAHPLWMGFFFWWQRIWLAPCPPLVVYLSGIIDKHRENCLWPTAQKRHLKGLPRAG